MLGSASRIKTQEEEKDVEILQGTKKDKLLQGVNKV